MNFRKSDRKLIIFVILLLFAESLWLLHKMKVLEISWLENKKNIQGKTAGYVMKSQKELRKRNQNSLVWEKSNENDPLFYQDSVLTLNQSSAILYLNEKTELQLSENTLVTIEESENENIDQIRLRFSRGNLKARNPFRDTNLLKEDWIMKVQKGSDINVRQTDSDQFEIEVSEGTVTLEGKEIKKELQKNQILQISKEQVVEVKKDPDLALNINLPKKTYTFNQKEQALLSWNVKAKNLILMRPGQDAIKIGIEDDLKYSLDLEPGLYTARIEGQDSSVSNTVEFEILQAPVIHLLNPLPRDRIPTRQEFTFIWSKHDAVAEYSLIYQDLALAKTNLNLFKTSFENDSEGLWHVTGKDAEGFVIPSKYSNQVYFQNKLFDAPKLKNPKMRRPANKEKKKHSQKSSWLQLLIGPQTAYAQESMEYEIQFEWEEIFGADEYTIEISDSENFREPELVKKVTKPEFLWTTSKLQKIYWRVAAGNKKGRMGLFSSASVLDLSKLNFSDNEADAEGIVVKRKEIKIEPKTEPYVKPEPPSTEQPVSEIRKIERRILLSYKPTYLYSDIQGVDQNKFKRSGGIGTAAFFEIEIPTTSGNGVIIDFDYFKQKWKPNPESEFVFQKNLEIQEIKSNILFISSQSKWSWGVAAAELIRPVRISYEEIDIEKTFAYGLTIAYTNKPLGLWQNKSSLSYLQASKIQRADLDLQFRKDLEVNSKTVPFWGFGFELNFHFYNGYKGMTDKAYLLIGIDGL